MAKRQIDGKYFGGKWFTYHGQYRTKAEAQKIAETL